MFVKYTPIHTIQILDQVYNNGPISTEEIAHIFPDTNLNSIFTCLSLAARNGDIDIIIDNQDGSRLYDVPQGNKAVYHIIRSAYRHRVMATRWCDNERLCYIYDSMVTANGHEPSRDSFSFGVYLMDLIINGRILSAYIENSLSTAAPKPNNVISLRGKV